MFSCPYNNSMKDKKKTKRIEFRVSEEEFNKIKIKARPGHKGNVSDFIRETVLGLVFGIRKKKK